jgi:hypothetical protein
MGEERNVIPRKRLLDCKVVLIYLINPPEEFAGGIAVGGPEVIEKEGRKFVAGISPECLNDWVSGLRISVAYDQIAHLIEFDSEEEFMERSEQALAGFGGKPVH